MMFRPTKKSKRAIARTRWKAFIRILDIVAVLVLIIGFSFYWRYLNSSKAPAKTIILSSGPLGSPYQKNGEYLKGLINKSSDSIRIETIASESSSENLDRLESKKADLVIAKRTVVLDKYYQKDDPFKNFIIILPLFEEAVQIIVRDTDSKRQTIPYDTFQRWMLFGQIKKIAIGPPNSSTNKTFRDIMACLNDSVLPTSLSFDERPLESTFADFEDDKSRNKVDCIVDFEAPPFKKFDSSDVNRYSLVTFDTKQRRLLTNYFNDLDTIQYSSDIYFGAKDSQEIYTVGTWALLLGSPTIDDQLYPAKRTSFAKTIIDSINGKFLSDTASGYTIWNAYMGRETKLHLKPDGTVNFDKEKLNKFFQGLPLSDSVIDIYDVKLFSGRKILGLLFCMLLLFAFLLRTYSLPLNIFNLAWGLSFGLIGIIKYIFMISCETIIWLTIVMAIPWLFYNLNHKLRFIPPKRELWFIRFKNRYGHWFMILSIALLVLVGFSFYIQLYELKNYQVYGVKSPLLNLTWDDTFEWLVTYMFTGHDGGFFPLSSLAKLLTACTFFVVSGTLFLSTAIQYFVYINEKKRNMGTGKIDSSGHFVICGWNEKTYLLVNKILEAEERYSEHNGLNLIRIVLLNNVLKEIEQVKDATFQKHWLEGKVDLRDGDPTNADVLADIHISGAKKIFIISEGKDKRASERVLLTAYAISNHCKAIHHAHINQIYMLAEVYDHSYTKGLKEAGVNVVISSGELVQDLVVQDSIDNGLYNPISELLRFHKGTNSFYPVMVKEYKDVLRGHTFDELNRVLRTQHLQLIGFKKIFFEGEIEVIDPDEINKKLACRGLRSEYIINPITKEENNMRTEVHDEIIVLATGRDDLRKIKNIKLEKAD